MSCDLIKAKSRVTQKKAITVPRLELAAAMLGLRPVNFWNANSTYPKYGTTAAWCDGRVVLGDIRNSTQRFHVYFASRVQAINNFIMPAQWHLVPSGEHLSDLASRGSSVQELVDRHLWWHGPPFFCLSAGLPLADQRQSTSRIQKSKELLH